MASPTYCDQHIGPCYGPCNLRHCREDHTGDYGAGLVHPISANLPADQRPTRAHAGIVGGGTDLYPREHVVSPCAACRADAADIGTFDHGIAHTLDSQCVVPRSLVDGCGRTGNHAFHAPPVSPMVRLALDAGARSGHTAVTIASPDTMRD